MPAQFTPFQKQAIEADGCDICVAAGAGSGKTGVLVERFLRLVTPVHRDDAPLEPRVGIDEILVITFTEKATKEMKSRIVAALTRQGLEAERRAVETAYISTIHGFCSRLLQENPFEAGVDPQFTVLNGPQARRLLHQTVEQVVAQAYESQDADAIELIATAQSWRQRGESGDPLALLANAIDATLAALRAQGRTRQEVEAHWRRGLDANAAHALEPVWAILTPLLDDISAALASLALMRESLLGAARLACDALLEHADALRPRQKPLLETLEALEAAHKTVSRGRPRANLGATEEITLAQLFQRIKNAGEAAKTLFGAQANREEQAAQTAHRLLGLTVAVWQAYEQAKRQRGALDTDDLQTEALRLLEESPTVRARYRRRFRHLMVDEFQDTNPLQMRLIELLHTSANSRLEQSAPVAGDARHTKKTNGNHSARSTPANRLFVVGDVQQSIYGFRHAEPALFQALERRFREEKVGLHVGLSVNFRSRPEILRLIEHVFKQVWRDEATPFVPLTTGAAFDAKSAPSLEILLTQDALRRDYVSLEADALAGRLQQLTANQELRLTSQSDPRCGQPIAYRDIAVLLRSLTDIQKYEEAFARRGVPCFVVGGGRGYYARPEIRDLLNVLITLDTPLDDIALAAALRSPLVGADVDTLYRLSRHARQEDKTGGRAANRPLYLALPALLASGELPDAEADKLTRFLEVIEPLRAQEDRLPVGHLLERLIAQTQYDARLLCRPNGRRRLANVRKLLQMANSDSVMGVREFIRRLRDLERLSDREGEAPTEEEAANVVRFLTIHGAKGLEFPVVVAADLARSRPPSESGPFVCAPQELALGVRVNDAPNVVYQAIAARREIADRKESERLLYVAMTRAREHLILCGNVGRNRGDNWADKLFPLLGVLAAPAEPETQILPGGLSATVAPLTYYKPSAPRRLPASDFAAPPEFDADALAQSLLDEFPLP